MANNLGFKITAEDQASRTVETVQHKIQNFGKDVAKMALGFAGPFALVQMGVQKLGEYWDELSKRQQSAIEEGSAATYDAVKAYKGLNIELDKAVSYYLALSKVKKENAENAQKEIDKQDEAIAVFKRENPKIAQEIEDRYRKQLIKPQFDKQGRSLFKDTRREEYLALIKEQGTTEVDNAEKALNAKLKQNQSLHDSVNLLNKETDAFIEQEKIRKRLIDRAEQQKKIEKEIRDLKLQKESLTAGEVTVSSIYAMGGGLAGESANVAAQAKDNQSMVDEQKKSIQTQIEMNQKLYDTQLKVNESLLKMDQVSTQFYQNMEDMYNAQFMSAFTNKTDVNKP